ncbi:MAG TPA: twin-arginine translocase subunit TatC [Candidatus Saccharimonadia bacterium]
MPALVLVGGIAVGYIWHSTWLAWLQAPLHSTLYYSDAADVSAYLLPLCLLAGLLFLLPFLVHRLVLQARPGAPNRAMVVMASYALVSTGVLSAYFVSLPAALHLLRAIDVQHLHPLIAANSYMSFVINYLAISAIAFQLPLLILCADYLTPIPPESLRKQQHVVIIGAFAVALILPVAPDPVSQVMLALPVVAMYELSFGLMVIVHLRRDRRLQATPPPTPPPGPQRLPMAIAVPHRPRAGHPSRMDPIRSVGPAVIDMRKHQ